MEQISTLIAEVVSMRFFSHDLVGSLTVLATLSAAMWFVIKMTFVKSIDSLNETMKELKDTIGSFDQRIDNLDKRTLRLEDWREYYYNGGFGRIIWIS